MSTDPVSDELERLGASRRAYNALRPRVADGEPWPLAVTFGTEPEASWGPREVLAHVAEMLPYWLGELERIVDGDGSTPVSFGRTAEDPIRIGMIERERTLPLRVLFARIDDGLAAWEARLDTLTDGERARLGLHTRLGELVVDDLAERFVVGHAEDHVAQLEAILADPERDPA